MFEIFLMSQKTISVMIADKKIIVCKTLPKKIEISDAKNVDINYYFVNTSSNIFNVNLCFTADGLKVFGEDVVLVKLSDNKYILRFCKQNTCFLQKKCKKIAKNDLFFNFFQNGVVEIETESETKFSEKYDFEIFDAEVLELKNSYYAIKLFSANEEEKCIIISPNFEQIFCFDSCVVEQTEVGFKVLTNLYDIAGHGLVEIFEIDEDVKKVDQYTVYMFQKEIKEFNNNVLPIYFLQCIKAGDYALAKKCLSVSLQSKVKIEHIKQFFGDFVNVFCFAEKIYLEYFENSTYHTTRVLNFKIENNVIIDIS